MDLRSNYAQSLVELDSLTRVNMNDSNSIKKSKMKALNQVVHHFNFKKLKYYDDSQPYNVYYFDPSTKYIWYIFISTNPLEMPGFKKINNISNSIIINENIIERDADGKEIKRTSYYDEYVKIMEFNGYNVNDMVTKEEFLKQYGTLEYNSIIDVVSGIDRSVKDFDYESFKPELDMPDYNAEIPKCCSRQFMIIDSKTNINTCLSCRSEFKVEITYNCPFCNNNQNEISVNGDGVYCINCNEDMDYGRSFNITKKVNCINHGINYERVPISYDIYDNTINPPSYKPL